jgi:hypothetical protein
LEQPRVMPKEKRQDFSLQIVDASNKPVKNMSRKHTSTGYKHKSKYAIKLSLIVNQNRVPLGIDLSQGHFRDGTRLQKLLHNRLIKSRKRPLTKLIGDKGYYGKRLKKIARMAYCNLITTHKKNAKKKNTKTEEEYLKKRSVIERVFARFYQFERIDKILDRHLFIYRALCVLVCAIISVGNIEQC